jgi:hypothetical protein
METGEQEMRAYTELPEGYKEIYKVDLQQNKKLAFWLNFFAALVGVAMFAVAWIWVGNPFKMPTWMWLVMAAADVAYIVLHELVHGITMKICGTKTVKYGFTGLYAFAGSKDYYDKKAYIAIALAPVVVWGVVLAIAQIFTPVEFFWIPWFIQITNISGAAGDAFVTAKFGKMPKDILVTDSGVGMTVYSKEEWKQ